MNKIFLFRFGLMPAVMLCLTFTTGCNSLSPKASEFEAVHRSEKSIVLIGLNSTWNDKPEDSIKLFTGESSMPLELAIASLDEGTGLKRTRAFTAKPSDKLNTQWVYLILEPGSYYVWGIPTTLIQRDLEFPLKDAGGFWMEVLPGKSVQYAGTLKFDIHGGQFIMEKFFKTFDIKILNENEKAAAVAKANFAQYGSIEVNMMQHYGQEIKNYDTLLPTMVVTHSPNILRSPDWKSRAMYKALGPARFMTQDASGYGAIGALGIAIVYYPIGLGIGSAKGSADFKKYEPCIADLNKELESFLPQRKLQQQLGNSLDKQAVIYETNQPDFKELTAAAARQNCQSMLLADIMRIQLRETAGGKFCVEVTARIRLWNVSESHYTFDQIVLYTNSETEPIPGEIESPQLHWMLPLPFPQPYEIMLPIASAKRNMDDYCGLSGRKIFTDELDIAINQTVKHFTGLFSDSLRHGNHVRKSN